MSAQTHLAVLRDLVEAVGRGDHALAPAYRRALDHLASVSESDLPALPDADLVDVLGPALVDTLAMEGWDARAEVARRLVERAAALERVLDLVSTWEAEARAMGYIDGRLEGAAAVRAIVEGPA